VAWRAHLKEAGLLMGRERSSILGARHTLPARPPSGRRSGKAGLAASVLVATAVLAAGCGPAAPRPTIGASAVPIGSPVTMSPTRTLVSSPTIAHGQFGATGPLVAGRYLATAVVLLDGRVLLMGGLSPSQYGDDWPTSLCELYDPSTATFGATGSLDMIRSGMSAAVLRGGRVLVAGGDDAGENGTTDSALLYDPAAGTFRPTGSLRTARDYAAAVTLGDGRVLFAGGHAPVGIAGGDAGHPQDGRLASAEVYDPAIGAFSQTGSMRSGRDEPVAVLLRDGRVLVTGGTDPNGGYLRTAETYDPITGKFTSTGSMSTARHGYSATALADGRVLIAGGSDWNDDALSSAEIYDPIAGKFTPTGPLTVARAGHVAVRLQNGKVLIAGGSSGSASAELYNPGTGTFALTGPMSAERWEAAAALLPDGRVLIAGGRGTRLRAIQSAEIYQP
jgi:hypothetical protein